MMTKEEIEYRCHICRDTADDPVWIVRPTIFRTEDCLPYSATFATKVNFHKVFHFEVDSDKALVMCYTCFVQAAGEEFLP